MKYIIAGKKNGICREALVGVCANDKYCSTATAPTMGRRHDTSEFKTIWSTETTVRFERLTAINHLKVLLEEFRWGDVEPFAIEIIPCEEGETLTLDDIIPHLAASVAACEGCAWGHRKRPQKCSCCRRNLYLKDCYEEEI